MIWLSLAMRQCQLVRDPGVEVEQRSAINRPESVVTRAGVAPARLLINRKRRQAVRLPRVAALQRRARSHCCSDFLSPAIELFLILATTLTCGSTTSAMS